MTIVASFLLYCPMAVLWRVPLLSQLGILAVLALAQLGALETGLIALAVFLQAVAFLAVAAFGVFLHQNLRLECLFVDLEDGQHCAITLLSVVVGVEAVEAVAAMANLVAPKAVAVEFQAAGLLAVAADGLTQLRALRSIGTFLPGLPSWISSFMGCCRLLLRRSFHGLLSGWRLLWSVVRAFLILDTLLFLHAVLFILAVRVLFGILMELLALREGAG